MESVNPSPAPDPSLNDRRRLADLRSLGSAEFLELLEDVSREVPAQLGDLRVAMRQGNAPACKAIAHALRGCLAYFGCLALTARLVLVENQDATTPAQADSTWAEPQAPWEARPAPTQGWERAVPDDTP